MYTDDGMRLNGTLVVDFIPQLFDAMMKTHLKTVVDAFSPNGVDTTNPGRRHRMTNPSEKRTFLVTRYFNDTTGIRYRVRVICTKEASFVPTVYWYNVSLGIVDTNLTNNYEFTTGKKRYKGRNTPKEYGVGYTWFVGTPRQYDGSVPFTDFLVESLTEFNSRAKAIDDKMQDIKNRYTAMKKAVDRF